MTPIEAARAGENLGAALLLLALRPIARHRRSIFIVMP